MIVEHKSGSFCRFALLWSGIVGHDSPLSSHCRNAAGSHVVAQRGRFVPVCVLQGSIMSMCFVAIVHLAREWIGVRDLCFVFYVCVLGLSPVCLNGGGLHLLECVCVCVARLR